MPYNSNIHKRKSLRLNNYDYSSNGLYFVTICTKDKFHFFGNIKAQKMELNDLGKIAEKYWAEIPCHYPKVRLRDFIVMPNHIHGIIELTDITDPDNGNMNSCAVTARIGSPERQPLTNDLIDETEHQHRFQHIIPRSLGAIVRGYKTGVTKWFRQNTDIHDVWQRNYYEHIIRDKEGYYSVSSYIRSNPAKWEEDRFFGAK